MSDYVIGGWTQDTKEVLHVPYSYAMYSMITNLEELRSGTRSEPGWSPTTTSPPSIQPVKALWTYGGAGSFPANMPATEAEVQAIVNATEDWDGVNFDDEAGAGSNPNMNMGSLTAPGVIKAMNLLKQNSKTTSYSFAAGYNYVQPNSQASENVQAIAQAGVCDQFVLLCYAGNMWEPGTIKQYVPEAIDTTCNYVDSKRVILALTTAGLNSQNLDLFLDQVTGKDLAGLFIWAFPNLSQGNLDTITQALSIG